MEHWICVTCGSQFSQSQQPPEYCPVCRDQRQYVGHQGQKWTTLARMQEDGFHNALQDYEPGLVGIGTQPAFAIKQRALLLRSEQGNILWDCISFLDDETVEAVRRLGGVKAIAISHPHYYSSMVEWAERFNATIYLHEADRKWVMRPSERINFWSGETLPLQPGITLVRLGGHFPGGTVLHWAKGMQGQGTLLTGDIITVVADRNWVSFMYSYPNLIPLPAVEVKRISDTISAYDFERIYGAWHETIVTSHAHDVVRKSANRYVQALEHILPDSDG